MPKHYKKGNTKKEDKMPTIRKGVRLNPQGLLRDEVKRQEKIKKVAKETK